MKRLLRTAGLILPAVILLIWVMASVPRGVARSFDRSSGTSKIDRWVIEHTTDEQSAEFLVILNDQADLTAADRLTTKAAKSRYVYETLYATAQRSQQSLIKWLQQQGVSYRSYYIVNALLRE